MLQYINDHINIYIYIYVDSAVMCIIHACVCTYVWQIYKKALTRQRILHPEEVSQLFPSLEDLVALHSSPTS